MKKIILLITTVALTNLAGAPETLTIGPSHGFSDYTKLTVATGGDRLVFLGFVVGDFNKDGRMDVVFQTGTPSAYPFLPIDFLPFGVQTYLGNADGTFTKGAERLLPN